MVAGDRVIDFFAVCGLGPEIQSLSGEPGYKCACPFRTIAPTLFIEREVYERYSICCGCRGPNVRYTPALLDRFPQKDWCVTSFPRKHCLARRLQWQPRLFLELSHSQRLRRLSSLFVPAATRSAFPAMPPYAPPARITQARDAGQRRRRLSPRVARRALSPRWR